MKIGLVLPYNITKGGGVKTHVLAQHDELTRRGHNVVLITPQPREPYDVDERKVAFLGSATDFKTPLNTTAQISASVLTDEIDSLLEREQFDILHFHEPWVPVLSRQVLSRSHAVNVATFHAKLPETVVSRTMAKVITPYTKPLLRHIDAFTAVSDAAAEYLLSLADVPVSIIPNGLYLHDFRRPRLLEKPTTDLKTILYVGRLENRKGVKYLLEAFQLLQQREPNVALKLAGDGADREKLEALTEELGLHHVEFLGYITDEEKLRLLHTADLFCSPALFGESFGIVLLEAMATGLVTVAGDNPGYASVMQGVGQLSLIDPKDSSVFAHRLQLLLFDDDLRNLWQKWAKTYVKQFDFPKIVDQYETVYQAALAAHNRPLKR
jgi:phosphatidylinositol alpha-mannosyltransferase